MVVCGRRQEALDAAKAECPSLEIFQGDVSTEEARVALAEHVETNFPEIDVLINNAGVWNRLPPLTDPSHGSPQVWAKHKEEMAINFEAPQHLTYLLLPQLLSKSKAQVAFVTSGLAFVPMSSMACYCATKAAMHSFTLSLRHQLSATSVSVLEIIPPAVNTALSGFGENLDEYADHVVAMMQDDANDEIGFKMSEAIRQASAEQRAEAFRRMNSGAHEA